jgi:hypothetical protein
MLGDFPPSYPLGMLGEIAQHMKVGTDLHAFRQASVGMRCASLHMRVLRRPACKTDARVCEVQGKNLACAKDSFQHHHCCFHRGTCHGNNEKC